MTFIKLLLFILVCSSISSGTFQNKLDHFKEFKEKRNKLERSEIDPSVSYGTFKNKLGRFKRSEEKDNKLDHYKRSKEKGNKLDHYKRSEERGNKLDRSNVHPPIWINFVEQVLIEDPTINKCFVSLNIISRKDSSQILNLAAFLKTKLAR